MLPELPKKRKKREASITPDIMKWFEKNYPNTTVCVEVKLTTGRLYDHQPVALKMVEDNRFSYKLPDMGRRNPFDFIVVRNAVSYIVYVEKRHCTAYTPDMVYCFEFDC